MLKTLMIQSNGPSNNGARPNSAINGGPQGPFNWALCSPPNRQPVCRHKLAALALRLLDPERLGRITREEFEAHRQLIRQLNDVPVLVTAVKARPDWLLTSNTEHFDSEVAARTGLRIVTPHNFLRLCGPPTTG